MNPVEDAIRKEGTDPSVVFVFPSDIAASLWLEAALGILGAGTLPRERFIAWDRFKEEAIQSSVGGKAPVSAVVRRLYALDVARRNAAAERPLLRSLIPEDHAASGSRFAPWVARILPSLALWESRRGRRPARDDDEDADLAFLAADYGRFLDDNALFEPAWQRPPFRDAGKKYLVFFPEAIEDWEEYADLLAETPFVRAIPVPDVPTPRAERFPDARAEISSCALRVEALLRSGASPESIAVTVPDLEGAGPYLMRELSLRGIPAELRSGASLGSLPTARLFRLALDCASADFAFGSVKALLLDRSIPWRDRALNEEIVRFGIAYHCVASWTEGGERVDIWREAFALAAREGDGPRSWSGTDPRELGSHFAGVADAVRKLVGADCFKAVRERYFAFRNRYLDPAALSSDEDAALARAVEELTSLVALESRYPAYVPESPLSFFVSVLDDRTYVRQRARGGVSVFPFRVAAGTPFPYHFILDASQEKATGSYRRLSFLRPDKRAELDASDIDASAAFFRAYQSCPLIGAARATPGLAAPGAVFSFADHAFTGWRSMHGHFTETAPSALPLADPLGAELAFLAGSGEGTAPFPDRLYPSQRDGFAAFARRAAATESAPFVFLDAPFAPGATGPALIAELRDAIARDRIEDGLARTSQSDLKDYAVCPARWFLRASLRLEVADADAELLNERNLGLLYHEVLRRVYERVAAEDKAFDPARADEYCAWAAEYAAGATAEHAEFRGPLAKPIIGALAGKVAEGASRVIREDAERFPLFAPVLVEGRLSADEGKVRYYGIVDRISSDANGNAVIVDYKSGRVPKLTDCVPEPGSVARDFQMPMYVYLAENSPASPLAGKRVAGALFADVKAGAFRPVLIEPDATPFSTRMKSVDRAGFEPGLAGLREAAGRFATALAELDFTRPRDLDWSECFQCDFKRICRRAYAVRPR